MFVIETFLVFSMVAFHFAIVPWSVRPDEFVTDMQFGGSGLEQRQQIFFRWRKAVGKFEAIVSLNAFDRYVAACKPLDSSFQEIGGRVSALLCVSSQKTQTGIFVNGRILEQTKLRIGNTASRNDLYGRSGCAHRDGSSAHRASAGSFSSAWVPETFPNAARHETGFPGNADSHAAAGGAIIRSCLIPGFCASYHESASVLLP